MLVVEDYDPIAEMLSMIVSRSFPDKRVLRATEGLEASLILGRYKPRLLLLDLMMPVMDGHQLLRLIAKDPELAELKVVIVSAVPASSRETPDAERSNVVAWFEKPMNVPDFVAALHRLLQSPSA